MMQEQLQENDGIVIINEPKLVWSFKDLQSHMQLSRNSVMKNFCLIRDLKRTLKSMYMNLNHKQIITSFSRTNERVY